MLTFNRVCLGTPDCEQMTALYLSAFPEDERRPVDELHALLAGEPSFVAWAIKDAGEFVGFVTYWDFDACRYVEHFAISSSCRGHGYGGEVIEEVKRTTALPVILEVEPPSTEQARRRVAFYQRHGFALSDYPYAQPSYRSDGKTFPMRLMISEKRFLGCITAQWLQPIYHFVYRVTEE